MALACAMRPTALVALPIWFLYVMKRQGLRRALSTGATAALVPLIIYATAHALTTGQFALTGDGDWLLYGRIGEISDCRGMSVPRAEQPLCRHTAEDRGQRAAYYIYNPSSPAVRAYGMIGHDNPSRTDPLLRSFALRVIAHRPLSFAKLVGRDFVHYFVPGARSDYSYEDVPITLPAKGFVLVPQYPAHVRWPAGAMRSYVRVVHTARPLMALFALISLAAMIAAVVRRRAHAIPHWREIALLSGAGLSMLLLSALSHFEIRYLLPSVPLLTAGAVLAGADLAGWVRRPAQAPAL
jgi:hypothetical protein